MSAVSVKFRLSPSAEEKLAVIETTALFRSVESGSDATKPGSPCGAAEPSVKLAIPPLVVAVGASLTFETDIVFVARFESSAPSLTLNSIVREGEGLSLVVRNWTDRIADWNAAIGFDAAAIGVSVRTPVPLL